MSDAPLCYSYDPATGLSLGPIAADPSPMEEGVWLFPAHTCLDAPPEAAAGLAVIRRDGAWAEVPDHRGETWWDGEGRAVVIAAVGDPTTGGLSAAAPPAPAPDPTKRMQIGSTFLAAVVDLGWWNLFDQGADAQFKAGKPLDARYWSSIGKADAVLVSDAKLNRVARAAEAARVAASGQPAPAQPVITIAAAMDHGDAMVAAAAKAGS